MKIYSCQATGRSGITYSVRLMLEEGEVEALMQEGIIPLDTMEVLDMQDVADTMVAQIERRSLLDSGGVLQ